MTSELSETYAAMKSFKQDRAERRRDAAQKELKDKAITFSVHNGGAHLICQFEGVFVDFWPGTGYWKCRSGKKGSGLANLIAYMHGESI